MKYANAVAMSVVVIGLAGCASAPKVLVQEPVGPCHLVPSSEMQDGSLRVYSARARANVDVHMEGWLWNNDYGKNEFLYAPAHSSYTVAVGDGGLRSVANARSLNDENPVLVRLKHGHYTVEAEAEEPGGRSLTVVVPLAVEAGQTTTVHLEPGWKPSGEALDPSRLVRLADGRIIGCRAVPLLSHRVDSTAPVEGVMDLPGQP